MGIKGLRLSSSLKLKKVVLQQELSKAVFFIIRNRQQDVAGIVFFPIRASLCHVLQALENNFIISFCSFFAPQLFIRLCQPLKSSAKTLQKRPLFLLPCQTTFFHWKMHFGRGKKFPNLFAVGGRLARKCSAVGRSLISSFSFGVDALG